MVSTTHRTRSCRGVTMIGAMVAVVILLIALIGTSTFRYTAALDSRRADAQTTASRVALLLAENRSLFSGDPDDLAEARQRHADELHDTIRRIDAIEALASARRAGALRSPRPNEVAGVGAGPA